MKRGMIVLSLLFSAVAGAVGMLDLDAVNGAVTEALRPFNNNTTKAKVEFTALDIRDGLTQKFAANGTYSKLGVENLLKLEVKTLDYQYQGPEGLPVAEAEVDLSLDLEKVLPRRQLNRLASEADAIVQEAIDEATHKYGGAATIDAAVDQVDREQNGDVSRVKLHVRVALDLAKLPPELDAKKESIVKMSADLDISMGGAKLMIKVALNPAYYRFGQDDEGLKEFVEGLLSGNQKSYDEVTDYFSDLDRLAQEIVDLKPVEP